MASRHGAWAVSIRRGMERAGLTQADLARATGERPQRINDWVKGRREPSDEAKVQLMRLLAIPVQDVMPDWVREGLRRAA